VALERRLKEREAEEKRLKNEVEEREKEVAALRHRMIETANSLQSAEIRIGEIAAEIARLGQEEKSLSASLIAQQENLGDVLAALQALEMSKPPALLVSPDDANEAARAAMLLADAAPILGAKAATLRADLQQLLAVRAERDQERAAFQKTSEEIAERRAILADLLEKKQSEWDVAAKLARAAQNETAALAARATDLRELTRPLRRLERAITPRLKPPRGDRPIADQIPSVKPRQADAFKPARPYAEARGALRPPVAGRLIGSFGAPRPEGGLFEGVRFAAANQAIVTSPYEANVAFARVYGPIGNLIVLDVGGGYHILLLGVGQITVQQGQKVAAGEPVGQLGGASSGQETSLDIEIRRNGEPVNPSLWLSRTSM
jgi:septal ring factor EnvC (AmiA/AmiB activator)